MKSFLLFLLLFLPFAGLCQSEIKIKGHVKDVETDLPIEKASIELKNSKLVVVTDKYGYFEINVPGLPVAIKISHICYDETNITIRSGDTLNLRIDLKYKINLLKTVNINEKNIERISKDAQLWAVDYDFYDNNILLLNCKNRVANSSLSLINYSGDTLSTLDLKKNNVKAVKLFKDCLGNIHVVTMDSAYQVIENASKRLELKFPSEISKFEYLLNTCVTSIDSLVYYNYYDYHGFISQCYSINLNNKNEQQTIRTIIDSATIERFERFFDKQHYAEIKRICKIIPWGVTDEELKLYRYYEGMNGKVFLESSYPPLFTPLINVNDTLRIFDHYRSQIEFYSKTGHFIAKVPVYYHQVKDWVHNIILDPETNKVYAVFLNKSTYTLKEISLKDGTIIKTIALPELPFVEKIKVHSKYVYFLYRGAMMGAEDNKMLYRMKIL